MEHLKLNPSFIGKLEISQKGSIFYRIFEVPGYCHSTNHNNYQAHHRLILLFDWLLFLFHSKLQVLLPRKSGVLDLYSRIFCVWLVIVLMLSGLKNPANKKLVSAKIFYPSRAVSSDIPSH